MRGDSIDLSATFRRGTRLSPIKRQRKGVVVQPATLATGTLDSAVEDGRGTDVIAAERPAGNPEGGAPRPLVAYFGPDLADSAVRRRVAQWRHAGFRVLPFAFCRGPVARAVTGEFVNLGRVMHLSRARRMLPLLQAALKLVAERRNLLQVDLFIARNLDNALLAYFARKLVGSTAPLVYEVLDVNRSCTEPGWPGTLLRRLEQWLLDRVNLLVVSSPYFATAYYQAILGYRRNWFVFENKVPQSAHIARTRLDPPVEQTADQAPRRWRIGWFGYLDDERSWGILRRVAERLPQRVSIYVRGMPYTNFDMGRFLADVERLDNVSYGGPYRNPEDLAEVYNAVDLVWSTDCNAPNANSKWLLTNGLYEAGYFGKPVIGLVGTAVGEFLTRWGSGWCIGEPVEQSLVELIEGLTPEQYLAKRRAIDALSEDVFVETDEIERIWRLIERQKAQRAELPAHGGALSTPRLSDRAPSALSDPKPPVR